MEEIPERVQDLVKNTRKLIKEINKVSESLSEVTEYKNFHLIEKKEYDSFTASLFEKTRKRKEEVVLRIEPKMEVKTELFELLYRSELVPERLRDAVSTGASRYGPNVFQVSVNAPASLRDYAIDQILIKLRKGFLSFSKLKTRKKLLELREELEELEEASASQREKEIIKEKINDLLFYTVQLS